ncbi:MAG: ChaN family lipoprotein, partial [Myxococcota bacterium]
MVSETELYQALDDAKVVYIGERHTSPHDHAVQIQIISALHKANPSLAIGLEMIKRPYQKWLDDYVAGNIDEATMLEGTEWRRRWGFNFALYRPIFAYARAHKIPLVALNIKDEITSKVAREGVEGLSEADKTLLPEIDFDKADHRAMLRSVYDQHNMGSGKMTFDNFYTAQLLWDETMAQRVAEVLAAPDAPKTMIVLAGSGHVRYGWGIPQRAARRGA